MEARNPASPPVDPDGLFIPDNRYRVELALRLRFFHDAGHSQDLQNEWTKYFITHVPLLFEHQAHNNTLLGTGLFLELLIREYYLAKPEIDDELKLKDKKDTLIKTGYLAFLSLKSCESPLFFERSPISQEVLETSIFDFSKREQFQEVLLLLSEVAEFVYESNAQLCYEYKQVLKCLRISLGKFFSSCDSATALSFGPWAMSFMAYLIRRQWYYDFFNVPQFAIAGCENDLLRQKGKAFCQHIIQVLATSSIEKIYDAACERSFTFHGDSTCFKLQFPRETYSVSSCLDALRPHLKKQYYSQDRLTKELLLELADSGKNLVARTYIFLIVHEYIRLKVPGTHWINCVIDSNLLEQTDYALRVSRFPLMIQLLGSYWPYTKKTFYKVDNIYAALALWFIILKRDYKSLLNDFSLEEITKCF
jgi:hypothetical protein